MILHPIVLRSVLALLTTALLISANACVFSQGPIKDFVLTPAAQEDDVGPETVADGNNTPGDETVVPATPTAEAPATPPAPETPPANEIPPVPQDVCHRIAFVQAVDAQGDEVIVGDDCVSSPKVHIPQQIITLNATFANQEPTFSDDGATLSTYFVSWVDVDAASIRNLQMLWSLENDSALLKDTVSGDVDEDGDNDLVRLFADGSPFTADGRLTVTAEQPVCGNGVTDGFEACDDGNLDDTDDCTSACENTSGFSVVRSVPRFHKALTRSLDHVLPQTIAQSEILDGAVTLSDGSVLFSARLEGDQDTNLYAFDVDDANAQPVKINRASDEGVNESQIAMASGEDKIVYLSGTEIRTCEILVAKTIPNLKKAYACTAVKTLSTGNFANVKNTEPCFSHDGRFVFFLSPAPHGTNGQEHDREVWRVSAEDGSGAVNVTDDAEEQGALSCSPAAGPSGSLK